MQINTIRGSMRSICSKNTKQDFQGTDQFNLYVSLVYQYFIISSFFASITHICVLFEYAPLQIIKSKHSLPLWISQAALDLLNALIDLILYLHHLYKFSHPSFSLYLLLAFKSEESLNIYQMVKPLQQAYGNEKQLKQVRRGKLFYFI